MVHRHVKDKNFKSTHDFFSLEWRQWKRVGYTQQCSKLALGSVHRDHPEHHSGNHIGCQDLNQGIEHVRVSPTLVFVSYSICK